MPIYEYRCSHCGHEFESLQKIAEAPLSDCPACHASALVKKVSAAGFQLKGSGWYATDFRSSGSKPAPAADSTSPDASKSDTAKPEATKAEAAKPDVAPSTGAKSGDGGSSGGANGDAKGKSKTAAVTGG